ncbi:MAG: cysteine desulfurase [Saprospiraceae bacterium]|nr:cysteine desulfurase [Saprospiraceae bacterium]
MDRIYFDNAATTPVDPRVAQEMAKVLMEYPGNPSSIHREGRTARTRIEQARKEIAQLLHASIGEIFFTSCGTESNNMALKCSVRDLGVRRIISARTEHHAVLHCLDRLETEGVIIDYVRQESSGHIDLEHLKVLMDQKDAPKTLVSLMHANNEIGTMLPLHQVAEWCAARDILFHSDTVQTMGYFPIDVSNTPIHFLTGSAHKFYGPKGIGFIYINSNNQIKPFIDGGSQERNMRAGTENITGIVGMAEALKLKWGARDKHKQQIRTVRDHLAKRLQAAIPGVTFNGDPFGDSHYKILSVSFPASAKSELLLFNLDISGISVSGGSACTSGSDAGSHVLDALMPGDIRTTIRFSFSHHNTVEEIDRLIEVLVKHV